MHCKKNVHILIKKNRAPREGISVVGEHCTKCNFIISRYFSLDPTLVTKNNYCDAATKFIRFHCGNTGSRMPLLRWRRMTFIFMIFIQKPIFTLEDCGNDVMKELQFCCRFIGASEETIFLLISWQANFLICHKERTILWPSLWVSISIS